MINFTDSLTLGLQSALDRERNFQEIHDIFITLKSQLFEFSEQSVNLEMLFKKKSAGNNNSVEDYFTDSSGLYDDKTLYLSEATNSTLNYAMLSTLTFSPNGYPCTLEIDGDHFDAIDKISLEENIKKLMSSPSTGQKLFKLMKIAGKV
ncbi:hypothetical protein OHV66_15175 [Acinetobacter baumannii]|nr:hypothetical protein [Acinetobacter baumannii]HCA5338646.1 hypothetical protein [Acinetobacter baumannii]